MGIINLTTRANKIDLNTTAYRGATLLSLIMATYNADIDYAQHNTKNRVQDIIERIKAAYILFKPNKDSKHNGAGTYGEGNVLITDQFENHYPIGTQFGIWTSGKIKDNDVGSFKLSYLASKVADFTITIKQYISIVFLNLFTYYRDEDNKHTQYFHFLYEILCSMKKNNQNTLTVDMVLDTIPKFVPNDSHDIKHKQALVIFNFMLDTIFFESDKGDTLKLTSEWENKIDDLLGLCNLDYQDGDPQEVCNELGSQEKYSNYITKLPRDWHKDFNFLKNINKSEPTEKKKVGSNILLYGVPGVGKSWTIQHEYCTSSTITERIVFYPDYTYSDFVGQILPTVSDDKQVSYEFVPGPFTRILKNAIHDSAHNYILIIEEINRGNASAIFGEIFQLLDRIKISDIENGEIGSSEYPITNPNIAKYVYGNENKKIRIPSNLSIIGTMNTSDQNVFTLDTAFQRRWEMRSIPNNFENVDIDLKESKILDTDIDWEQFCTKINEIIVENNFGLSSTEDKRLGVHFIDKSELDIKNNTAQNFADKVIKYLWDDAFKYAREDVFNTSELKTLEQVSSKFVCSEKNDRFSIFADGVKNRILASNNIQVTNKI